MKLIQGDCITEMQKLIDEGVTVDCIITDPPYNISQKNDVRDRSKFYNPCMRRDKPVNYDFGEWDNMERKEFLDFTSDWYNLCVNLLDEGGAMISFFNKEDISYLNWLGKTCDMRTRSIMCWHKTNPVPSFRKVNYLSACEYIWIGSKGSKGWKFNFLSQKEMHNFYETPNKSSYGVTEHPTEKPLKLIEHLLRIHTNEGDKVLDCFMGSGTTGVGCVNLNRNFIGIEQNETYYQMAEKRIKEAYKKDLQTTLC